MAKEKLMERARDELFSHINRCGVLKADFEDQETWMQETIDYIAERYPDLGDGDLEELHQVGIRFCKPAIPHGGGKQAESVDGEDAVEAVDEEEPEGAEEGANAA